MSWPEAFVYVGSIAMMPAFLVFVLFAFILWLDYRSDRDGD